MNLGVTELVLILVIALLFFGPSKLPGLGKAIGETIKGFKKGMSEGSSDEKKAETDKKAQPQARLHQPARDVHEMEDEYEHDKKS